MIGIVCLSVILIMSLSVVSAGIFSDFFNKLSGKAVTEEELDSLGDAPKPLAGDGNVGAGEGGSPEGGEECVDTDGGAFAFIFGETYNSTIYHADYCYNGHLMEGYCDANGIDPNVNIGTIWCGAPGCSDGECGTVWPEPGCIETDNGKDYDNYGYNYNYDSNGNLLWNIADICAPSGHLLEVYCGEDFPGVDPHSCENGCLNGACIDNPNPPAEECTDTDNGINFDIKGSLWFTDSLGNLVGMNHTDECIDNNFTLSNGNQIFGGGTFDYYCNDSHSSGFEGWAIACEFGCEDSFCIDGTSPGTLPAYHFGGKFLCDDLLDGGINYNVKGNTTRYILGFPFFNYSDFCTGDQLTEHYCSFTPSGITAETYDCENGCENGACIETISNDDCVDTDGGKTYDVHGNVIVFTGDKMEVVNHADFCKGDYIMEMYCDSVQGLKGEAHLCEGECKDGRCVASGDPSGGDGGSWFKKLFGLDG